MKNLKILNFPLSDENGEMTNYSVVVSIEEEKLNKLQNQVWSNSMDFFNEVISECYRALNMELFDDHEDFYVDCIYSILNEPEEMPRFVKVESILHLLKDPK